MARVLLLFGLFFLTLVARAQAFTIESITVTTGTTNKLAFTTQPSSSTISGNTFAQQPVVTIQDAAGNTITTATDLITLSLTTGTGTLGGTLSMNAVKGVADFSGKGLNINQAGTDKVLTASATGLTSATTTLALTITAPLAIGDSYQGGIIFYIFVDGDPGYVAEETHGLIAAEADQTPSDSGIIWAIVAKQGTAVGGTGIEIGKGKANTDAIIAQNGEGITYAAGLARAYNRGGYNDWYLPSKDELGKLYLTKGVVGGFADFYYWSSTEVGADNAWLQLFSVGDQRQGSKAYTGRVRAVRAF